MSLSVRRNIENGSRFALSGALLLYSDGQSSIASFHDVRSGDQGPEIGPGDILSGSQLRGIAKDLLEGAAGDCCYLPERVLGHGISRTVWWTPAGKREIHFTGHAREAVGGVAAAEVAHPPLVFAAGERALQVFALSSNERPKPNTPLLRAPYPNVYGHGGVCLGSAKVPHRHGPDTIEAWEAGWNESSFSHANSTGGDMLVDRKGGVMGLWRDLVHGDLQEFPTETLVDTGYTLNELLSGRVG